MLYLLIFVVFVLGFLIAPIYSVVFGLLGLLLNTPFKIKFTNRDHLFFVYITVVSFLYLNVDSADVFKEIVIFIFGPFIFYLLGKSNKKYLVKQENIILILFCLLSIYGLFNFFKDTNGFFNLNLDSNYYYLSRSRLIVKSNLDFEFMNETNFSLIILTSIIIGFLILNNLYFKVFTLSLLFLILLILGSRTAVLCSLIIALFYILRFKSLKFIFFVSLSFSIIGIWVLLNINLEEIPYVSVFFKRIISEDSISASSLNDRFYHFLIAIENSDRLIDVKGYKFLLYNFNFSSHNEILGHTSAVGIIPALFYFGILVSLIKNGIKNLKKTNNIFLYKILISLTICYFIIGLTENIYISNIIWIYMYFFIIGISTLKNNHA